MLRLEEFMEIQNETLRSQLEVIDEWTPWRVGTELPPQM
jgi:hypothetical protein